ncbi:MAG TPA: ribonuclease HI family protein [Patescibacteria group bacterium]|nr:ribonuclease HI family protein [Patescibacteria group bacterium]
MKQELNKFSYTIYTDGGSRGNPGPSAYGFVVYDGNGKLIREEGKTLGIQTNNYAEYTAIISSLKWIEENSKIESPTINIRMDSQLAARQLSGIYQVKNEVIRGLFFTIKVIIQRIKANVVYTHVPREQNKEADRMVNLALDGLLK